jgi:general secretion pathway protein D
MPSVKMVADDRTNSVLISGEDSQRLRLKTLIAHLDTPLDNGGDTQVRYLRYADAEKIAGKLREQLQGITAAAMPPGRAVAPPGPIGTRTRRQEHTIWAEPETNALVVTAPPKTMRSLMAIVDKLDIRRAQVLVEAILVEMSADKVNGPRRELADRGRLQRQLAAGGGFISPSTAPASARSSRAC